MDRFVFNYNRSPNLPPCGEIKNLHDIFVKVKKRAHLNIYFIDNSLD